MISIMKAKVKCFFEKICNYKNNIIIKVKKSLVYKSKIFKYFGHAFQYCYEKIIKHKHMIIPIIILFVVSIGLEVCLGSEFSKLPIANVPTVVVNHDTSETTQNLVDMISQNDTFNVIKYSENNNDIKELIDKGEAMVGILIPDDFSENILNGHEAKIMTFYDGALSSVASTSKGKIAEVLNTIKSGYLMKIAEGKLKMTPQMAKSFVAPLGYSYRLLGNPANNMAIFMLQGLVLTGVQVGIAAVGAFICENKSILKLIMKGILVGIIGTICSFICVAISVKQFHMPYKGSIITGLVLSLLCNIGNAFIGIFFGMSVKRDDKEGPISSCSLISLTMLLAGYTFPVMAMPEIFSKIEKWLPNSHYIIPLREISLLGNQAYGISSHIIWLIKFILVMIFITSLKFFMERISLKKKAVVKSEVEV